MADTPTQSGPWQAYLHDHYGDQYDAVTEHALREGGAISIRRDSARPAPGSDKIPGHNLVIDVFAELDLDEYDTVEEAAEAWQLAQAAAEGMNRAHAAQAVANG